MTLHSRGQLNPASKESEYHGGGDAVEPPTPTLCPKGRKQQQGETGFGWDHCPVAGRWLSHRGYCWTPGTRVREREVLGPHRVQDRPPSPKGGSPTGPPLCAQTQPAALQGFWNWCCGRSQGWGAGLREQAGDPVGEPRRPRLICLLSPPVPPDKYSSTSPGAEGRAGRNVRPHWLRRWPLCEQELTLE